MGNKPEIDEKLCPHCKSPKGRGFQGGFKINAKGIETSGPTTVCLNCREEIKDFWWCDTCLEAVKPEHVTYEERHDPRFGGCGMRVV